MKVDVKINHQKFQLGEPLDQDRLERAHFKKVPVVQKLIHRSPLLEKEFIARDCTLSCFDGNFELYPCRERYLDPDRQWKTAVNLFYRDQKLRRVLIQVLDGCYAAPNFLTRFREVCESELGEPRVERRFMTRWEHEDLAVATILKNDGHNATVLLAIDE
jgi:hypothetical protein